MPQKFHTVDDAARMVFSVESVISQCLLLRDGCDILRLVAGGGVGLRYKIPRLREREDSATSVFKSSSISRPPLRWAFVGYRRSASCEIAMAPQWDETRDAWVTQVSAKAFGLIGVIIHTDGVSSPPTPRQLSTLELAMNLPSTLLTDVASQARVYAEEYMMEDDYEDLTDTDFSIRFSTCMVPRLRETTDHYFFLIGDSDIDEEHGIACLFKNHDSCRICHTDVAYNNYGWDDTVRLDFVLR